MSSYGKKQLEVIRDFGKKQYVLHSSCMGTGKTYAICSAFIFYCAFMEKLGIYGLNFVLLAETQATAKRNLCNLLAILAGSDFRYDSSKKDGLSRDARLFSHNLYICGLSDSKSVERFRGISNITGIIQEEVTLSTEEQFALINSRLRGEYTEEVLAKWPEGYVYRWWVGSTNPSHPEHFIKKKCDSGEIHMVEWNQEDANYKGAKEYFLQLEKLYKGMPALYERNVKGLWTSAEGAVYPMFNRDNHILTGVEVDLNNVKYNIISVDYGSNHPTAILCIAKTYDRKYIVYKDVKLQRTAPSEIIKTIKELIDFIEENGGILSPNGVIVDPSAVGLKDEMDLNGLLYSDAFNRHDDGIAFVSSLLSENRIGILEECNNLISEIYTYRYKQNSIKDEVLKVGDDFCDSLRYGVYTDFKMEGS